MWSFPIVVQLLISFLALRLFLDASKKQTHQCNNLSVSYVPTHGDLGQLVIYGLDKMKPTEIGWSYKFSSF